MENDDKTITKMTDCYSDIPTPSSDDVDANKTTDESIDDEYYLPDLPLYEVMSCLDASTLRSCRSVSLRFREMAGSERIWRNLTKNVFPPTLAAYAESPAFMNAPSAQARYGALARSRNTLRGIRNTRPSRPLPSSSTTKLTLDVDVKPVMTKLTFSSGPLFCASACRGPSGLPAFLTAGGSGSVNLIVVKKHEIVQEKRSSSAAGAAAADNIDDDNDNNDTSDIDDEAVSGNRPIDAFSSWTRNTLWPSLAKLATNTFSSLSTTSIKKGIGPHGIDLHPAYDWHAHDAGLLGLSVDETGRDIKGAGPTVITGAFSGEASLWRLNADELHRIKELPAKRLKELLTARGVPFEDLTEKEHFVSRLIATGALPVARLLARFDTHRGTVVSVSHSGRIALTSSHDGTVKMYVLNPEFYNNFVPEKRGPRPGGIGGLPPSQPSISASMTARREIPTINSTRQIEAHDAGVDVVSLETNGRFLSGGKDGDVACFDTETGQQTFRGSCGQCWVWIVRSAASVEGLVGTWAGAPSTDTTSKKTTKAVSSTTMTSGGGVFSHPDIFISGDTGGFVRLWDRRQRSAVSCIYVNGRKTQIFPPESLADMATVDTSAIAGIALAPWDDTFITTGFDGVVRFWDARIMTVSDQIAKTGGDPRIARATLVAPDIIAAGCMDGSVIAIDCNASRSVTSMW